MDQAFSHLHAGPALGAQARTFLVREEKDRHFANPWLCCRWLSKTADERQNARFEPPFSTAQTGLSNDDPRQVADELRDCGIARRHICCRRGVKVVTTAQPICNRYRLTPTRPLT
ncbi:MAG: hypothetical protein Q8P85_08085 [Pseudomonas sp.]|nr:hypothetical protein [Pseudomonas sp.]